MTGAAGRIGALATGLGILATGPGALRAARAQEAGEDPIPAVKVVAGGDATPWGGTFSNGFGPPFGPVLDGGGGVTFVGHVPNRPGGGEYGYLDHGMARFRGGALEPLAYARDPVPALDNPNTEGPDCVLDPHVTHALDTSGSRVVFTALITGTGSCTRSGDALLLLGAGPPSPLVMKWEASPVGPPFGGFTRPQTNAAGQVLFGGHLEEGPGGGRAGLFLRTGGATATLALEGDPTPIGGTYRFVGGTAQGRYGAVLTEGGDVAFFAEVDPDAEGIFAPGRKIVATGDPAPDGGTFADVAYAGGVPMSMNNRGLILFDAWVTRRDGSQGLAVYVTRFAAGPDAVKPVPVEGWPATPITDGGLATFRMLSGPPEHVLFHVGEDGTATRIGHLPREGDPSPFGGPYGPVEPVEVSATGDVLISTSIGNRALYALVTPRQDAQKIAGVVRDGAAADGHSHPMKGVRVELYRDGARVAGPAATDAQGRFEFTLLAPGTHRVRAWLRDAERDPSLVEVRHTGGAGEAVWVEREVVVPGGAAAASVATEVLFSDRPAAALAGSNVAAANRGRLDDMAEIFHFARFAVDRSVALTGGRLADTVIVRAYDAGGTRYCGQSEAPQTNEICITANQTPADPRDSDYADRSAANLTSEGPMNLEWHEFSHALFHRGVGIQPLAPGDDWHRGFPNSISSPSLSEGFAMFWAMALAEEWPGAGVQPYIYANLGNLETATMQGRGHEDWGVAQLLWDVHDAGDAEARVAYRVDVRDAAGRPAVAELRDTVNLGTAALWTAIDDANLRTVADVRAALVTAGVGQGAGGLGLTALDTLFLLHGFYADSNGNGFYDAGEPIGYATDQARPNRRKTEPEPGANLLLHLRDGQGNPVRSAEILVRVELDAPIAELSFSYATPLYDASDGLLHMEPPQRELPATITLRARAGGAVSAEAVTLTNAQYWALAEASTTGYALEQTFTLGGPAQSPEAPPPPTPAVVCSTVAVGPCAASPDTTPPHVVVSGKPVSLTRDGVARVRLTCPADEPDGCTGTLTLRSAAPIRRPLGRGRIVTLGSASFDIRAGETEQVGVRLSRAHQRIVERLRSLKTKATAEAHDAAGNVATVTGALALKPPRR